MTISTGELSTAIEYPDTDRLPMAESDFQREYLIYAVQVLRIYFQDHADVYVSGNLFIYYEQGNYLPMPATVLPDGSLSLTSEVLGLELRLQVDSLRFYDLATGEKLLTHQESEQARREAEQARQKAMPRLLELGLSVEQVAEALSLSVQELR